MNTCEVCGQPHDGSYGSGRFCSDHCKRVYTARLGIEKRRKNGTLNELAARARAHLTEESYQRGIATRTKRSLQEQLNGVIYPCPFCGRLCKSKHSLNGHQRLCQNNPQRQQSSLGEYAQVGHIPWNKGLTKETNESIKRGALGVKRDANSEKRKLQRKQAIKRYWTEDRRHQLAEKQKKFLLEHPEKHPNRILANNRDHMSYPERVAFDWLTSHHITFEHQKQFGKYFADFYLPEQKLIIEIDGERWHNKQRDAIRDAWIKGYFTVTIVRILAKEHIEERLQQVVQCTRSSIG